MNVGAETASAAVGDAGSTRSADGTAARGSESVASGALGAWPRWRTLPVQPCEQSSVAVASTDAEDESSVGFGANALAARASHSGAAASAEREARHTTAAAKSNSAKRIQGVRQSLDKGPGSLDWGGGSVQWF